MMRLALFSYWANTYFGGAVAAIGGALVLGALPRIKRHQRVRDAAIMAVGLALLANTRPYESLFFCIPIAGALLVWMLGKKSPPLQFSMLRVVLPLTLLLAIAFSAMGFYFWRVTGSPFRIPYQVNIATYHLVYFPWQKLGPPAEYHHEVMREFYQGAPVVGQYRLAHLHPIRTLLLKPIPFWLFYLGPVLTLPFFAWLAIKAARQIPLADEPQVAISVAGLRHNFCGIGSADLSPPGALLRRPDCGSLCFAAAGDAFHAPVAPRRTARRQVPGPRRAPDLLRAAAAARGRLMLHIPLPPTVIHTWYSTDFHNLDRARVLAQLRAEPGRHLAIVRYQPDHEILEEWVYNEADIDGSKVVWARDMGAEKNQELIDYYKDRRVWLVEPDEKPVRVTPYEGN